MKPIEQLADEAVATFSGRTYSSEQDALADLRHLIVIACCQAQLNALDSFTAALAETP